MAFVPYMCWLLARKYTCRRKNADTSLTMSSSNTTTPPPPPMVQQFSWEEICTATQNFRMVVAQGGFSTVYRAVLADESVCAVKVQSRKTERLRQVYAQELHALLAARHSNNLVKLLGYCDDDKEAGVLVLEYVTNGNLHDRLHEKEKEKEFVPWRRRMGIAIEIASALEYLHEVCDPPIIHCDIKSSNVLLDHNFNAKLCDFGFSKTGDKNYLTPKSSVMGSPGYIDPHCLKTGIVCKKNDVYSYGVLLLELITGMEAFSADRELLAVFASPFLEDTDRLWEIIDCRFHGCSEYKQLESMACIAASCIRPDPQLRPSITEILQLINAQL